MGDRLAIAVALVCGAACFALATPTASADGLPKSLLGTYVSYPPGQKSAPRTPTAVKLVSSSKHQVKGGEYPVKLALQIGGAWHKVSGKYDPKKETVRGYGVAAGNGLRFSLSIREVMPGYDMTARYTFFKGASANAVGTASHSYRKHRRSDPTAIAAPPKLIGTWRAVSMTQKGKKLTMPGKLQVEFRPGGVFHYERTMGGKVKKGKGTWKLEGKALTTQEDGEKPEVLQVVELTGTTLALAEDAMRITFQRR